MSQPPWASLALPEEIADVLGAAPRVCWVDDVEQLFDLACSPLPRDEHEVRYSLPEGGSVVEASVARVRNGIVVNYPEPYMRRREPDSMVIVDDGPTDKPRFRTRFGYDFGDLREQTFSWLREQELAVYGFVAGPAEIGVAGLVLTPANAGFFALALGMLQRIVPLEELRTEFRPRAVIYVAPPFRHTHFGGKQVVVHNRGESLHELFAYNLYPGPSAKKGVYSVLIQTAEKEGWVAPHCSTVQVITPYDNIVTIMHEGASGGGKSEMLEQIHREPDGRLLLGHSVVSETRHYLEIPRACELRPVTDDIAVCHPSFQRDDGYLRLADGEHGWFVRVNHIREYGTDPYLEKLTAQPPHPLLFLNIDAVPDSRALIWEHVEDEPGKPCPNARVILPRRIMPGVVDEPVAVDIRSFGVRVPPCTRERPSYGIIGVFHLLPASLAWLWRLVSPRGFDNPSIVETEGMSSEGVGSYWPFATGRMVTQANLLLDQFRRTPGVRYVLCPNQHVGAYRTGFMPQWIAREYLARRGHARFREDQLRPARCPLLGHALEYLQIEGRMVGVGFLQVEMQSEVGPEAYDEGAATLTAFFHEQLTSYLQPDLLPLGREIIECCLAGGGVDDYERLLPGE
ncbi:MAG: DUF4914 family protein [Gaiellaceae bacterium]